MTDISNDGRWRVERSVPLLLIVVVLLNIIGGAVWVGGLDKRVEGVEGDIARRAAYGERLVRVETELVAIRETLMRIDRKLDRRVP